jgi:two-component system, NarL family, response regulator DegU
MKTITRIEYLLDEKKSLQKRIEEIDEEIEYRKKYRIAESLSKVELKVVSLVKLGLSNAEIAEILKLSVNTIKKHLSRIFVKLDIKSRYDLLVLEI